MSVRGWGEGNEGRACFFLRMLAALASCWNPNLVLSTHVRWFIIDNTKARVNPMSSAGLQGQCKHLHV